MIIKNNKNIHFIILFVILSLATPINIFWTINTLDVFKQSNIVDDGNIQKQIALIALGVYAIWILFRKKFIKIKINNGLSIIPISFLLTAGCSFLWADDIYITGKRIVALLLISTGIIIFAKYFSYRESIKYAFWGTTITLLIAVIAEIINGTFKPLNADYRFSGIFHPNAQGQNCALLLVISIMLAINKSKKRRLYKITSLISFIFLILTKSRAALLSVLVAILIGFIISKPKIIKRIALGLVIPIFIIIFVIIIVDNKITDNYEGQGQNIINLGRQKDEASWTYADRKIVWDCSIEFFFERPILGYGYNGFWNPKHIVTVTAAVGRGVIASAHSAYIDMILSLGIVGVIQYLILLSGVIVRSIFLYKKNRKYEYAISATIIVWFFICSIFESIMIQANIYIFMVFIIIIKIALNIKDNNKRNIIIRNNYT